MCMTLHDDFKAFDIVVFLWLQLVTKIDLLTDDCRFRHKTWKKKQL